MGVEQDHAALGGVRFEGFLYWAWYDANGLFHRVGAPAVIYDSGHKIWYQHGRRHRMDGPAVVYANGRQGWYLHGRYITDEVKEWMSEHNITCPFTAEQATEFALRWG